MFDKHIKERCSLVGQIYAYDAVASVADDMALFTEDQSARAAYELIAHNCRRQANEAILRLPPGKFTILDKHGNDVLAERLSMLNNAPVQAANSSS